jgi:tetratricopeptide (TPR) repeat protein
LRHLQRSLEISERFLQANPESAEAARDVSLSLERLADLLAGRNQPGDTEQVFSHYERSLAIRERLLQANTESGRAARDVALSLDRLVDFLARRGQPGDGEQAFGHSRRSLEIRERLLQANPESAQAERDITLSLERLADFLGGRGQPGDDEQALGYYERSLEIRERLLDSNPESTQAARDLVVLHFELFEFHRKRGEKQAAKASLVECFTILEDFAEKGRPMDAQMRMLYSQLQPLFKKQ